jgi:membrane protease YdiL (CAAX protease family)
MSSIVSQVCTFLLPALFITWWFYPNRMIDELHLRRLPKWSLTLLAIFFLFTIFPLAQWLLEFNKSLPLPEWAVSLEQDLGNLSKALLVMESPWELIFNLLTIAVIPAVGEELLFRGVLQDRLSRWTKKPHVAVWLAAIIFSAVHGQFEGFLARLALGAALGYLLYWTNNLWIPIIAHFFNNGLQVVIRYFQKAPAEVDSNGELPILLLVVSIILAAVLAFLLANFNRKQLV